MPADHINILEPVSDVPFNQDVTGVWPREVNYDAISHMRVVVSGELLREDGLAGHEVVGYVEIELK